MNMSPYLADKIIEETVRDDSGCLHAYRLRGSAGASKRRRALEPTARSERGLGLVRLGGWRLDLTLRRD